MRSTSMMVILMRTLILSVDVSVTYLEPSPWYKSASPDVDNDRLWLLDMYCDLNAIEMRLPGTEPYKPTDDFKNAAIVVK